MKHTTKWKIQFILSVLMLVVIFPIQVYAVDSKDDFYSIVEIHVVDEEGIPIKGALFNILDLKKDLKIKENLKTDANGVVKVELMNGEYKIVQISTPKGYLMADDKTFRLDVKEKISFENERFIGILEEKPPQKHPNLFVKKIFESNDIQNKYKFINKEVVYCYNAGLHYPTEEKIIDLTNLNNAIVYEKELGSRRVFWEMALNKQDIDKDEFYNNIIKIIYYGYNDAYITGKSKIQTENDLSDDEFRFATQLALWYYTDYNLELKEHNDYYGYNVWRKIINGIENPESVYLTGAKGDFFYTGYVETDVEKTKAIYRAAHSLINAESLDNDFNSILFIYNDVTPTSDDYRQNLLSAKFVIC